MGLFRKKHELKNQYDDKLIELINKQKKLYEADKQLEELMIKDHPEWETQLKLQKAKYFYLFKEARIRQVRGDHLSK